MKALKITFLLLAVLLLTVSGQSSSEVIKEEVTTIKKNTSTYDLMAHAKKSKTLPPAGL
ncbi:hypothetical protein [Psychroserpens algicola]|uniref:Uncharacterized protein n=1 Tax=Psychroserpens algicola TaxID=1719034 RepID=A0ABT0H4J9_9FLAO|nr:hypothetical protein [Psychroserpens algicola]MCK8479308.1 hypothetical protein [Psychroserpens algicola]